MTTVPAAETARTQTSYQVLMLVDFSDPEDGSPISGWMELSAPVQAANAEAAIRKKAPREGSRKLVAVPARSWKPITVTIEQTTTIKLG